MADREPRELFPVTFFHGDSPVVLDGSDFRPQIEWAGQAAPVEGEITKDDLLEPDADNLEDTEQPTTAPEMAEKRRIPAPD